MFSLCSVVYVVFFFKQKTAYEMRISDWSSDVCSSDLVDCQHRRNRHGHRVADPAETGGEADAVVVHFQPGHSAVGDVEHHPAVLDRVRRHAHAGLGGVDQRSEEHTSELQSLMRISYAVFCLTKKIHYKYNSTYVNYTH